MMDKFEEKVILSGIGQSTVGRRTGAHPMTLTMDAALAAIEDAGLRPADIDGVSAWPGSIPGKSSWTDPSVFEVKEALGLSLNWWLAGPEGPGQLAAIINAAMAVASGLARHVLCYRTLTESTGQGMGPRLSIRELAGDRGVTGRMGAFYPYGFLNYSQLYAVHAQRYINEFKLTREQLGSVAVNGRRQAQLNPNAIYRTPLSLEQYLDSPIISSPFCIYDCDVPIDGSTAVIVSDAAFASDCRNPAVHIESVGTALHGPAALHQWIEPTSLSPYDAARHMWRRSGLKPSDIDVAQMYDGFSIHVLTWLEAFGLCKPGEGGSFVSDPSVVGPHGKLPLNTDGGMLSAGRLHGFGHVHEAVLQVRGQASSRQAAAADVVAVGVGGHPATACMLLTSGSGA